MTQVSVCVSEQVGKIEEQALQFMPPQHNCGKTAITVADRILPEMKLTAMTTTSQVQFEEKNMFLSRETKENITLQPPK